MPQKPLNKIKKPGDARTALTNELYKAALFKVNGSGKIINKNSEICYFLLNPSTWEDAKETNWIPQTIPGQSDPVFQWVSGGARIVTFQALVTKDTALFSAKDEESRQNKEGVGESIISQVASGLFGIKIPLPKAPVSVTKTGDLDISEYLNYYRSLLYPKYSSETASRKLLTSPPLVVLAVGSTLSKVEMGKSVDIFSEVWVVSSVRIQIRKQLPNLAPMEALVDFQLMEYTQLPKSEDSISDKYSR